jgi:hypothetical protein
MSRNGFVKNSTLTNTQKNEIYLNKRRLKNTFDSNLFNKILSFDHFLETQ